MFKNKFLISFIAYVGFSYAIPDFNLYLVKLKGDEVVLNWNQVLNIGDVSKTKPSNINLINLAPLYVETNLRKYTTADVIFAVRDNQVIQKTKKINEEYSLANYSLEENEGCLNYSLSLINKETFIIRRLNDSFCYQDYLNDYPTKTFTYNTQISKFSNNQNGYAYLFIFDQKKGNDNVK